MITQNDDGQVVHRVDTVVDRADMLLKKGQLTQRWANFLAEAKKVEEEIKQVEADIAAFDALQPPAPQAPAVAPSTEQQVLPQPQQAPTGEQAQPQQQVSTPPAA